MASIENILEREFPELKVEVSTIPVSSDIEQDELIKAIQYIRNNKLVQDSEKILSGNNRINHSSVTYPIIFPDQKRDLNFRVDWVSGPMLYVGYIETDERMHVRMYGMRIANTNTNSKSYLNIVNQLDELAVKDAEARTKTCADLGNDSFGKASKAKIVGSHLQYVRGLGDALRIIADIYGAEYNPISPKFPADE